MRRRLKLVSVAVATIAAAVGLIAVGPSNVAQGASMVTRTFDDPGEFNWTVPSDVTEATFHLYGAQGGGDTDSPGDEPGGLGAHVSVTTPVTPGENYTIVVGSKGTNDFARSAFGGGGAGGRFHGGGGGGGTWVVAPFETDDRTGNDRLLVAGGGGGSSGLERGGAGGLEGDDGEVDPFEDEQESGFRGAGGSGTEGGVGGNGGQTVFCTTTGQTGGFTLDHRGADGGDGGTTEAGEFGVGGGGGGGGYFGGGGGGGGGSTGNEVGTCFFGKGGGGGGGSSFSDVSGASIEGDAREGEGLVTISFVQITPTTTTLTASANPSVYGQDVTYTATVTAEGGGVPTGTVQFALNGVDTGDAVTVDGNGVAVSEPFDNLPKNTHLIGATFLPAAPNDFMTSSDSETHVVNEAQTATSLTLSPNPAVEGQPITFAIEVEPVAPGMGTPTGSVVLSGAGSDRGIGLSGGRASGTIELPAGAYQVTASYRGNDEFFGFATSTSDPVGLTVQAAADVFVTKTLDRPVVAGDEATYTLTSRNDGPSPATNFVFKDLQPAGTIFSFLVGPTDASPDIECGIIATGPACNVDELAAGVSLVYRVGFAVDPFTPNGSSITNTLIATSDTFDPNSDNNTASVTTTVAGCTRRITGSVAGAINVAAGEFVCVDGAIVGGGLTAGTGARVAIRNARFGGQIRITSSSLFVLCNSQALSLDVRGATGAVHVGRPNHGCPGNILQGSAIFDGNRGATRIGGNTISAQLVCYNNSPAPTNEGARNTAASRAGQCAAL